MNKKQNQEEQESSWYNRISTKSKQARDSEDDEDISIMEWIDLMEKYKKTEEDNSEDTI